MKRYKWEQIRIIHHFDNLSDLVEFGQNGKYRINNVWMNCNQFYEYLKKQHPALLNQTIEELCEGGYIRPESE